MENLIFLFHFLRLTLLHYIYPNPRLSFHFFILFWLLCAFYYCKSLLPTIGRLDPRVPPDSVLLHSTVKLAPGFYVLLVYLVNRSRRARSAAPRAP